MFPFLLASPAVSALKVAAVLFSVMCVRNCWTFLAISGLWPKSVLCLILCFAICIFSVIDQDQNRCLLLLLWVRLCLGCFAHAYILSLVKALCVRGCLTSAQSPHFWLYITLCPVYKWSSIKYLFSFSFLLFLNQGGDSYYALNYFYWVYRQNCKIFKVCIVLTWYTCMYVGKGYYYQQQYGIFLDGCLLLDPVAWWGSHPLAGQAVARLLGGPPHTLITGGLEEHWQKNLKRYCLYWLDWMKFLMFKLRPENSPNNH